MNIMKVFKPRLSWQKIGVVILVGLFAVELSAKEESFVPTGAVKPEHYLLKVPTQLEKGKRYPMIIFLHGHGNDYQSQWMSPMLDEFRQMAAQRGFLTVSPGRD